MDFRVESAQDHPADTALGGSAASRALGKEATAMVRLEALAAPSSLGLGLTLFAGGFAGQIVSVLVSSHVDGGPLVWLPGGLLLAVLMSIAPSRWLSCVTGV